MISQYLNKIKKYTTLEIVNYFIKIFLEFIYCIYGTFWFKLKILLNSIKIGKNTKVWGSTTLSKSPGAKIVIGDGFRVVSGSLRTTATISSTNRIKTYSNTSAIIIGNNVSINGVSITSRSKSIFIGNNVKIAPNCIIVDSDFHCLEKEKRTEPCAERDKDVYISDDVWIGMNCTVLKGITIGKNTIVGANSLVNKSLDENAIYAGNPIRKIKNL